MNPLKRQQSDLLVRIGCDDLERKVNEIVRDINSKEEKKTPKTKGVKLPHEAINKKEYCYCNECFQYWKEWHRNFRK
jgi:hypothetical protein